MNKFEYNSLGSKIVDAAYSVHRELGAGFLESVYEYCMLEELRTRGLTVNSQVKLPLIYKGIKTGKEFFVDILVEDAIIIELKACEKLLPIHEVQILTYMKLADKKLGYLINFNVPLITDGIRRKINGYL